jgi:hypothetical protein
MSTSNPQIETITIKQRIFIAALAVVSVLLSALVLFCFSPAGETSEALPCGHVLPAVYHGSVRS